MLGFLKGFGAGSVVAVLGLVAGSQMAGLPDRSLPEQAPSDAANLTKAPDASAQPASVSTPPADAVRVTVVPTPEVTVPKLDAQSPVAEAPAAPAPESATPVAKAAPTPAPIADAPAVLADPLLVPPPAAEATAPAALTAPDADLPSDELRFAAIDETSVDPVPPMPAAPDPVEPLVSPLALPTEPPELDVTTEAPGALAAAGGAGAAIVPPKPDQAAGEPVLAAPKDAPASEAAPKAPAAPPAEPAAEPAAEPIVAEAPKVEAPQSPPQDAEAAPSDTVVALVPAQKLPGAPGVVTGRLPSIGSPSAAEGDAPTSAADAATDDPRPLVRFARAFEGGDGKPLFAILLVDTGAEAVDIKALKQSGLPFSIVIDPLSQGAAERAAAWRTLGQEVVMQATGLPVGATAKDVEETFQQLDTMLPESIGVIDLTGTVFQGDRPLASSVVPVIGAQGRGLITLDRGVNSADQVAQRQGVPAAKVFRVLDGGDEAAPLIRRYLDRAAFKAAQEGEVVVLGQLRPETLQAILEWAIEGRAATMALAPVSAVLLR